MDPDSVAAFITQDQRPYYYPPAFVGRATLLWGNFAVERQLSRQGNLYDPWPVFRFREDDLFKVAQRLVHQRNLSSIDNYLDRVVLLPASGGYHGFQGGSNRELLYSLRSPSLLPRRMHVWRTSGGKIMVRHNLQSKTLSDLLGKLGEPEREGRIKNFALWRSMKLSDVSELKIPENFREDARRRWHAVNTFPRFLDLAAELREMILQFTLSNTFIEPWVRPLEMFRGNETYPRKPIMGLTLVSKQLNQEAMTAIFACTTFVFRESWLLRDFMTEQPTIMERVRSLYLEFSILNMEVLWNSGAPSNTFDHSIGREVKEWRDTHQVSWQAICIHCSHPYNHFNAFWDFDELWDLVGPGIRTLVSGAREVQLEGRISPAQKDKWMAIFAVDRENMKRLRRRGGIYGTDDNPETRVAKDET